MKILAVSHEFPPIGGGGANACYYITKELAQGGHQVMLITANYQNMPEEEQVNGVHIIRVSSKRAYKEHCSFSEMLSYLKKGFIRADRLQKQEKFDICLVFFGIPSGPIGWFLKKKYGLPYIIRFGGGDIPGFQERFTKIYKLLRPFIKTIWRNADFLIANSEGLRKLALNFYDKKEIEIICNGVDTEKYYPKPRQEDPKFHILFVSRLIKRKGLQFFIPQMKAIQEQCEKKIKLTVVGDGPYRKSLEELADRSGVRGMVDFAGQKGKDEIVMYYQDADVFILPSEKEGMPNVVLEAMACGLPVIMTPCEGSTELVQGNGYVVKAEDFGEKVVYLAGAPEEAGHMGQLSRKRAEENFRWESIAEKYLSLLERSAINESSREKRKYVISKEV